MPEKTAEINYDANTRAKPAPMIQKKGCVDIHCGEMSPFVYKNHLCVLKHRRDGRRINPETGMRDEYAVIYDETAQKESKPFGWGIGFMSAFCENDHVFVFGRKKNRMYVLRSDDLETWTVSQAFELPERFELFNSSVCRGDRRYIMAFEVSLLPGLPDPDNEIGVRFTEYFAESQDLMHWNVFPYELGYSKDRYTACPAIRFADGFYYLICLEELPLLRYAPYIYRTKDFHTWEIGIHNPVLMFSNEDRKLADAGCYHTIKGEPVSWEQIKNLETHMNINNCDVDLCEYQGQTHIYYCTGNQLTEGYNCKAVYHGTLEEFLKAHF